MFAEESRGCNVLEMQTAQNVCRARGPTDKNNHFAISKVNSLLHEFALLNVATLLYIQSGVSARTEKLLRYEQNYVTSDFAVYDTFLVTQRRILAWTKTLLCYIWHFVVSDFAILLYLTLLYPASTVHFKSMKWRQGYQASNSCLSCLLDKNTRQYLGGYPQQRVHT